MGLPFDDIAVPFDHVDGQQGFIRSRQALHPATGGARLARYHAEGSCERQWKCGGESGRAHTMHDLRFPAPAGYSWDKRHVRWRRGIEKPDGFGQHQDIPAH